MDATKFRWLADIVLLAVLLAAVWTDLSRWRIPNWLTYPAMLAGLAIWTIGGLVTGGWSGAGWGFLNSLLGLLLMFLPMLFFFSLGGVGGADVKLTGAIGALGGIKDGFALYALLYGAVMGGVFAVVVMIRRRLVRQTMGRVWRFIWLLATGARPVSPTDAKSPRLASALPWAIGTVWAMVELHCWDGHSVFDRIVGR